MAFFLYNSNRLENLLRELSRLLIIAPAPPMQAEQIVVQHPGMGQWVQRQLAQQVGIAANLEFPLPGRFIGSLIEQILGENSASHLFSRDVLLWRIYQELPSFCSTTPGKPLAAYVSGLDANLKTYQLAGVLSDLFDQYQVFRPDILRQWDKTQDETITNDWQPLLWKILAEDHLHRSACLHQTLQALFQAPCCSHLPEQVYLFGLHSLAPVYLEILVALSQHIQIHLFHLTPCQEYWGDILSDRQLTHHGRTHQAAVLDQEDLYLERGNPLLASLGGVARDFHNQLLEYEFEELDFFEQAPGCTILSRLQNHILYMKDGGQAAPEDKPFLREDCSLTFHICHAPLREIQVLHDYLLTLFSRMPGLQAGDILVMAPDMQAYAQAVQGVFLAAPEGQQIPFSINDQPCTGGLATVQTFLDLLTTLSGKCPVSEILSLLESEPLHSRFHLNHTDLPKIRQWIKASAIHWGLDQEQREQLGMQDYFQNSWQDGLEKLMLAYFFDSVEHSFNDRFPATTLPLSEADTLGGFTEFIAQLQAWSHRVTTPRTLSQWIEDLLALLEAFFVQEKDEPSIKRIRDGLEALLNQAEAAGCSQPIEYKIVIHHLTRQFLATPADQVFLSGRVTFCNMVPMRSVPFRVICMLGMQDDNFPRSGPAISFSLLHKKPRTGDRNRRNDDRYLFLEALLSARDALFISWVGRSRIDNSEIPPSTVVSELQDYLDRCFRSPDHRSPATCITREHPLQPFSRDYFKPSSPVRSHARAWLPSQKITPLRPFAKPFSPSLDRSVHTSHIDLAQLARFWQNPCRFFLEQQVGMRLAEYYTLVDESEPFLLNNLDQFLFRSTIIADLLNGRTLAQSQSRLLDSGHLPQGAYGDMQLAAINEESVALAEAISQHISSPPTTLDIDTHIGDYHVIGRLNALYPAGRITWRSSRLKASSLMEAWVYHLFLCRLKNSPIPGKSMHYSRDKTIYLHQVKNPEQHLMRLLDLYVQGLTSPLPFFPESSLAGIRTTPDKAEQAVLKKWQGNYRSKGEREDAAYRFLFGPNSTPVLDPESRALVTLLNPILAHWSDNANT